MRSGQATIALIDPRQIQEAKAAGLTIQAAEKNALWDIYLNVSRPGLSDVRVRQALMYALDREALSDAIVTGPPSQRLNLIILGDGYQKDQQSLFYKDLDRNLALELVRVTEAAAMAAVGGSGFSALSSSRDATRSCAWALSPRPRGRASR